MFHRILGTIVSQLSSSSAQAERPGPSLPAILGLNEHCIEASLSDLLGSAEGFGTATSLVGDDAQVFLNVLLEIIDDTENTSLRAKCRRCLRKLSEKSGMLPSSLFVDDIERLGDTAVTGGGFADIWHGTHRGQTVALKVLRIFTTDELRAKLQMEFCREALVWRQLKHPNITPFIGVSRTLFAPHMCMISPWMKNGNLLEYLHRNPEVERQPMLHGVALGIAYLHSQCSLVHGDIRGANVLISDDLQPMLSDFGLARIADTQAATLGTASKFSGSTRWMAPELFAPTLFKTGYGKFPGDVYAFGCFILEIFAGKPPFMDVSSDSAIMFLVLQGTRPDPPIEGTPIPSYLWEVMELCWQQEPQHRPSMDQVVRILDDIDNPPDLASLDAPTEESMRSITSSTPTTIKFENQRENPVHLYWINFKGKRVSYGILSPDEERIQLTYLTHPWVVVDEAEQEVLGFWDPVEQYTKVVLR